MKIIIIIIMIMKIIILMCNVCGNNIIMKVY